MYFLRQIEGRFERDKIKLKKEVSVFDYLIIGAAELS